MCSFVKVTVLFLAAAAVSEAQQARFLVVTEKATQEMNTL